jgi:hypothetical protein
LNADLPEKIQRLFGIVRDRHVMAIIPAKRAAAIISLFGGEFGTAVIDLGFDARPLLNQTFRNGKPFNCLFSIPLDVKGSRPLEVISIRDQAAFGHAHDLLPLSRSAAP